MKVLSVLFIVLLSLMMFNCEDSGTNNWYDESDILDFFYTNIELVSPEDKSRDMDNSVLLEWKEFDYDDFDGYIINVANKNDYLSGTIVIDTVKETYYRLQGLEDGTEYLWRIGALSDTFGINFTKSRYFTIKGSRAIKTVKIGEQEWMLRNLDVTHYRNGDKIPQVQDPDEWKNLTTGAWCYYNNDSIYNKAYGKLYNWYAVNDPRGLAPEGWKVPSHNEFNELELFLGMNPELVDSIGRKAEHIGAKLAGAYPFWSESFMRNHIDFNSSGFEAAPGGYRYFESGYSGSVTFGHLEKAALFWTYSEANQVSAYTHGMHYYRTEVLVVSKNKGYGISVRCIRE